MKQGAMSPRPAGSRRRTGTRTRRQRRAAAGPPAVAGVRRKIPIYHLASEEGLDLIDRTTDRILKEAGPGNHFFGCAHTLSNYETDFHECEIADTDSYENRCEAGGKDSMMRANAEWKEILHAYEPPPLDASVDEGLDEFMARKKAPMPDIRH